MDDMFDVYPFNLKENQHKVRIINTGRRKRGEGLDGPQNLAAIDKTRQSRRRQRRSSSRRRQRRSSSSRLSNEEKRLMELFKNVPDPKPGNTHNQADSKVQEMLKEVGLAGNVGSNRRRKPKKQRRKTKKQRKRSRK